MLVQINYKYGGYTQIRVRNFEAIDDYLISVGSSMNDVASVEFL